MNIEQFYRENYHIVFGYLLSLSGNKAIAEDLASEVFLKAIVKIDTYDGRVKASTWLCAIGKNLYLNERKRFRKHVPLDSVVLAEEHTMEEKIMEKGIAKQNQSMRTRIFSLLHVDCMQKSMVRNVLTPLSNA